MQLGVRSVLAALSVPLLCAAAPQAEPPPKDLGLVEHAERRLVQIDVALEGPRERISNLTLTQFRLTMNGRDVTPVAVDAACPTAAELAQADSSGEAVREAPTSFLFYFDQRNMTQHGRMNAIDRAAAMIPKLVRGGNRATIISSGAKRVVTFVKMTGDTNELLAGLERLRKDGTQWDEFPALERTRQESVTRVIQRDAKCAQARVYQREELQRGEQSLAIFSAVLGRFADVEPPKTAIYFADTLRAEPGRHYLEVAGPSCEATSIYTSLSFVNLHADAAKYGVKVYAMQAEGLVPPPVSGVRNAEVVALKDGQGGLKTLALETGGDAFLNGAGVAHMVGKIESDASCVYVLSFDPAPFPEDKPLPVRVDVDVPGIRTRSRTRMVIQSESSRRSSTLLAAFTAPENLSETASVQSGIIPLDVDRGQLRMLIQAAFPETTLPQGEAWDIGMTVSSGAAVPHETSGRLSVAEPGVTIILESEVTVPSGTFEASFVGMETLSGRLATGRLIAAWPGRIGPTQIASIAVLQPVEAAFLRDGVTRTSGSLVIPEDQPVAPDRPTALVTLVCRSSKRQTVARIERALTGPSASTFPPLGLSLKESACAQVRDVIPGGTLAAGSYTYSIRVEGAEAGESRTFTVVAPASVAGP